MWTHHEVEVTDALRGARIPTVIVSEPGGSLDGVHQSVSGALQYRAGEDLVLFLYRTPVGFVRAVGGGQGKFTVGSDGRARANIAGMELVDLPGRGRGTPLRLVDALDVQAFKQRVRDVARVRPLQAVTR